MKKIKILFYLPNLEGGGAERVAVNIIRQLNSQQFDIVLVLVKKFGVYLPLIPDYVTIHDLDSSKTSLAFFKTKQLLQNIQPDILFSTLFRTHILLYLTLLGVKKKPYIISRSPNSPKLVLEKKQLSKIMKFLLEKAYNNSNLIIAQTPEMKKEIISYHHIKESKIEVLLNPLDTDYIDEKISNIENPFNANDINVVAAGRLNTQKGFDVLINSFQSIVKFNNKFVLHIIGKDGGEEEKLKKLVTSLNLNQNIKFLGFQNNPYKYFFFSDLYVLSSLWEGLPNTVLENLYLNKRIVATRCIPFMNQLITHGKNGLLVDIENTKQLADAIINYESINNTENTTLIKNNDFNNLFKHCSI